MSIKIHTVDPKRDGISWTYENGNAAWLSLLASWEAALGGSSRFREASGPSLAGLPGSPCVTSLHSMVSLQVASLLFQLPFLLSFKDAVYSEFLFSHRANINLTLKLVCECHHITFLLFGSWNIIMSNIQKSSESLQNRNSNRPLCSSVLRYRSLSLHGPLKFTDFAISLGSACASWCFARLTTKLSLLNFLPPHRGPLPLTPKPSCSDFHETSQERGFLPSAFSLGPGKCIFPEARV